MTSMTTSRSVAVYARISQDRAGDALGVTRQLEDCRAEAFRRGWVVGEEYVDDDVSAYSGKARPAYERMLRDIAEGLRDAVIVWHMDRLHRRPIELEQFADTCAGAGVKDVITLHGDIDLANGDGLLMARLLAAVAANESDSKRRRLVRKAQESAEAGRPKTGGPRPYCFANDFVTHVPAEVAFFRKAVERVLAGESLQSVVRWLDESGARTARGNPWTPSKLRALFLAPRYWGMRAHRGQIIAPAVWEPVITAQQGERLRLLLTDPARGTQRPARRYLLSGLLRCSKCGGTLYSAPKRGVRGYSCLKGAELRGCGGTYIYAAKLEAFIADIVLTRLDTPALMTSMTTTSDRAEVAALGDEIAADTEQMETLAKVWADRQLSTEEWKAARNRLETRVTANRRALARLTQRDAIEDYLGQGAELRGLWEGLNLSRQVAIVKAIIDRIVILPVNHPGRNGLDPARVHVEWRL